MARKKAEKALTLRHYMYRFTGEARAKMGVQRAFCNALDAAGATVLQMAVHHFDPQGFTSVALLSESHASLHTWPERDLVVVDYFSCAENPRAAEFVLAFVDAGFVVDRSEVVDR